MVAEGVFVTSLMTSYCSADDVRRLLSGYDLSALGTEDDVLSRIQELLATTRTALDAEAGRDFLFHIDDELLVDGNGQEQVLLGPLGVCPVSAVHELQMDGRQITSDGFAVYATEGAIRLKAGAGNSGRFAAGIQNVHIRLDWGYATPPDEIALAQAKLCASDILAQAAGERGSVESLTIGDYSVRYDSGGEHASVITRWIGDAERTARSYRAIRLMTV